MPCVDTNFLIELIRGNKSAQEKIRSLEEKRIPIKTTALNAAELYRGANKSDQRKENIELIELILGRIQILDFNIESAKVAGWIMEDLRKRGESISSLDILIASVTLANNETIITKDAHFKRIKELRIETW